MSHVVLVLCHNDIRYIKPFKSLVEAESTAVVLANEWYNQDGLDSFSKEELKTVDAMNRYYHSEAYFNSDDFVHVVIEEVSNE